MRTSALHLSGMERQREIDRHEFRYSLTSAPSSEPVTLAEAKLFCRIDTDDDDALVTALIAAARQTVEKQTGRALITQTWTAKLDRLPFAGVLNLSYRPIQTVTSIKAYNEDGTSDGITIATGIILDGQNGRISLKSTAESISGDRMNDVFEVVYVAGYGAAGAVPEWAKTAIKQIVAHWYENRESAASGTMNDVPLSAKMIIEQNQVLTI